jgi:PPOX class probable F420-dependent enzyme
MELTGLARRFVAEAPVGRFATVDQQGAPHIIPICFALVGDHLYSVVDQKPKRTTRLQRLRNIEANPSVALVIDRYSDDWSQLAWVMVRGDASVIESGEEYALALRVLREKYPQYRSMDLDGRPMIRLSPDRVNAWGIED